MAKPVWTLDQIVSNLARWNKTWPAGTAIPYSFHESRPSYYMSPSEAAAFAGFSSFSAAERQAVRDILALISDVANVSFVEVPDSGLGPHAPSNQRIAFAKSSTLDPFVLGQANTHWDGDTITYSTIFIESSGVMSIGFRGYATLTHEILHALGLLHPADYSDNWSYENDAIYFQDSKQYTVMSYFSAANTGADHATGNGYDYAAVSPLLHDVATLQHMYGANNSTRTSNTTYGGEFFDAGREAFMLDRPNPVTIWDAGGIDRLDFSGEQLPVFVDLEPGAFSNFSGLTDNLSIAFGTIIEDADGGAGNDVIHGNAAENSISGNGGEDVLEGNDGDDALFGGDGDDTLTGGPGDDYLEGSPWSNNSEADIAVFSASRAACALLPVGNTRVVVGPDGRDEIFAIDTLQFADVSIPNPAGQGAGSRDFEFSGREGILWQNKAGPVAIWRMDGSTREYGATLTDGYGQIKNPGPDWKVGGAADFNGDGYSDVLFQNLNGQAAIWLIDHGEWAGGDVIAPNPGPAWHMKGAGDFDGDGKADILWQHDNGQAAVWLMDGTARIGGDTIGDTPGSAWRIIGSADFNGDFKADILWQNTNGQPAIWLMNGTTRLAAVDFANPGLEWIVKGSGDFNRDGMSDILWQHKNGQAAMWFMNGTTRAGSGTISTLPPTGWEIAGTGNFNNDGYADIVWQHDSGLAAVWLMNGADRIGGDALDLNLGTDWQIANYGAVDLDSVPYDFDGDGRPDLLWQNVSGQAAVWQLDGTSFVGGDGIGPNPGPSWSIVGSGDFNGDDRADILWQNRSGQAAVWLMDGTTLLGDAPLSPNPGTAWHAISAADFNNDGKTDILWQNDSGAVAIWFMDGTSRTADGVLSINPGSAWHVKGSGDFNSDGKADILWQHNDGSADVWLMDGLTKLGDAIVGTNPGPAWHVIGSGDFNGDGRSDILWQHDGGQAAIWLVNGTQYVSGASVGANNGPDWDVIGACDFNGDMKSDILWQHDNGQAAVWLINGTTFQSGVLVGVNPSAQWELAWA